MITVKLINALSDNYIACLINPDNRQCVVVDPGDAAAVFKFLTHHNLILSGILITHHHWDHTNGIMGLLTTFDVPVYGPAIEPVTGMTHPLNDGDQVTLDNLDLMLKVIHVPGHTLGHIAYHNNQLLFAGDTLFTGGSGRIFEGTVEQMYTSLSTLAALNENTLLYCGHEYTAENLKFAQLVEPHNLDIQDRVQQVTQLREKKLPTIPAPLSIEKLTNPFLRCHHPDVTTAAEIHAGKILSTPQQVLGVIRQWKNSS
jgi:hydroxyacylglutathione hydrolase